MKRLSASLISCFVLLFTTMSAPALAEVKDSAQQLDTSALQDALTSVTDGVQSVIDGAKANISELLHANEAPLVSELQNAQTPADASSQDMDGARTDSSALSNVVPSSIPGVVWNADYTTCTIQTGTSVDATHLKSEIDPHASTLTTFIAEANTSLSSSASALFMFCRSLSTINLAPSFDTSGVTNMHSMFAYCSSLSSLTLPAAFNTSAVTTMGNMFNSCSALQSLTLPDAFNTSAVEDMSSMFERCSALQSLTLPDAFDTGAVEDMFGMFSGCSALSSLTLPAAFKTGAVEDMSGMFSGCSALSSLSLPAAFDTSAVDDMSGMFFGCSKLSSLTLPAAFDTSEVDAMSAMFSGCTKLNTLDLSMFSSEKLTDCMGMFANCDNLKELNLGNFVPPAGQASLAMFADVDMETGAVSGSIPSIEKITTSGSCILEPGEGTTMATATGTFFDYKEPLSWSAYYQGNRTEGQSSEQTAQNNLSAAPDAVLTGFDEFKAYQETHPGLTTYVFDENPTPPGPTPGPTPEPTPTPTPDVTPASDTAELPLTGDTFAGLSWMALAAIAGALTLSTGWLLHRKREL